MRAPVMAGQALDIFERNALLEVENYRAAAGTAGLVVGGTSLAPGGEETRISPEDVPRSR